MATEGLYRNRVRAEIFGAMARNYDRYRATYPSALLDDLVAADPKRVLDVACGTGKVAVALHGRGLSVLGIEPDGRMAEVARGHGVKVEIAPFESWDDAGRRYDLITCGDGWHWIEPEAGIATAARVLRAGGTIARFWNYYEVDPALLAAFEPVYREHAPESHRVGDGFDGGATADPFEESDMFQKVEARMYRWEWTLDADEWVGLATTYGDHHLLGAARLAALQHGLRAVIAKFGGTVRSVGGTYLILARRA